MNQVQSKVMDSRVFRNLVGNFGTGVTIITTKNNEGKPIGFTANSFASLSLDPQLILFSIDKGSSNYEEFMNAECFSINILAEDQIDLCKQFATKGIERFAGVGYYECATGCPILPDTLAYIDCKITELVDGGDHTIIIGEVMSGNVNSSKQPLIFFQGQYKSLV
ncbi:flavin reductase family protein [Oceanobacillus sp. CF4.6]|uniref:flavin reductase family protein n=1 Tax=Oceanobacillus sp. CF4.6 TaxID=3373080 RepID=UPI003EE66950